MNLSLIIKGQLFAFEKIKRGHGTFNMLGPK
jgi:hypothetical protein